MIACQINVSKRGKSNKGCCLRARQWQEGRNEWS